MKEELRRYKLGYALSSILFLISIASTGVIVFNTLPELGYASDKLSAFLNLLWTKKLNPLPGLEFKLIYLMILAGASLISGTAVFAFSRQWFALPSKIKRFQCPFCKKNWSATHDRGQVMCPHCHHLIHPKII